MSCWLLRSAAGVGVNCLILPVLGADTMPGVVCIHIGEVVGGPYPDAVVAVVVCGSGIVPRPGGGRC